MMDPRLGIILFARMASRRLPGKMLQRVGSTSLLERVVARARLLDHPLVLATSSDPTDDVLCELAAKLGLAIFRGSVTDVLGRACLAAKAAEFDGFARLCGDRPFLPLDDMRKGLAIMENSLRRGEAYDLVTTALPSPVPPGLLTEIIRTESLEAARELASTPEEREHVTSRFYTHRSSYRIYELRTPLQSLAGLRLAVDTESDRRRIGALIGMHPDIALSELIAAHAAKRLAGLEPDRP